MRIRPVPNEQRPEGFPGFLSIALLGQSRVVSGCMYCFQESVDVFVSGVTLSYFWCKESQSLKVSTTADVRKDDLYLIMVTCLRNFMF